MKRPLTLILLLAVVAVLIGCGKATPRAAPALSPSVRAGGVPLQVAVASNFSEPLAVLAERFTAKSGQEVRLSAGATGKLYAQIRNGAPFDAFFSADAKHPQLLADERLAVADTRFTYAVGRVVLWSTQPGLVDPEGAVLSRPGAVAHLAIANPELAPYGEAARAVLQARGVWAAWQPKLVTGENIAQVFQFVASGNAELGFVALSQLRQPGRPAAGSAWEPPPALYPPLAQQAIILKDGAAIRAFMAWVRGAEAQAVIQSFGYGLAAAE